MYCNSSSSPQRPLFSSEGMVVQIFGGGRWYFLTAPPPESGWGHSPRWKPLPLLLCGVLIDSFPSVHGGSPWALPGAVLVLYFMQWRLPVHTNCSGNVKRGKGGGRREEERTKQGGAQKGDNGEQIEEMDVETETRSGVRLKGQLYQAGRDKTGNLGHVSTVFNHTWQLTSNTALTINMILRNTHVPTTAEEMFWIDQSILLDCGPLKNRQSNRR